MKFVVGDSVGNSPVGPGKITGFSESGSPQVNGITVMWAELVEKALVEPVCLDELAVAEIDRLWKKCGLERVLVSVIECCNKASHYSGNDKERHAKYLGELSVNLSVALKAFEERLGSS